MAECLRCCTQDVMGSLWFNSHSWYYSVAFLNYKFQRIMYEVQMVSLGQQTVEDLQPDINRPNVF